MNEILEVSADTALLKGNLFLNILPPETDPLEILLDGTAVSKGLTKDLPAGKHVLKITGTGILHEQDVSILSDETLRLTVTLKVGGQFTATFPLGAKAALSNGTSSIALESGVKIIVEPGAVRAIGNASRLRSRYPGHKYREGRRRNGGTGDEALGGVRRTHCDGGRSETDLG